ncbi:hypothetical protein [Priestia megaterium]|uniref:hypothetical protein n=1 Tax=Priestia megaterium TaxID=1404 RepID=UPI000BFBFAD9|nr:hypothetical protein [Priestia megaterium]PGO60699.1 hypothetical protein CN981_09110 [Priestia megaterium]
MSRKTRLQKSTAIGLEAQTATWCYVDTDNRFKFLGLDFAIDQSVDEYKVHKKAGTVTDYTNEAYMEQILGVLTKDNTIKFYNQNYDEVEKVVTTF